MDKKQEKDKLKNKNCGCKDGEPCTCGDDCHCEDNCDCGCEEGKACTCGDDCHCHDHKHEGCDCGCEHEHCDCEDDCGCHDHEHCDCGCEDEHCNCGCEHQEMSEEYKKYEQAFIQLEDALIRVDKELEETKKVAKQNEHLAISYKKDLDRYKERAKAQEEEMKVKAVTNIADKLIPILDNFEQALKVSKDPSVLKGFEMIESMLKNAVKQLGIEEIDAEGAKFDPNLHNAVSKQKTKDKVKADHISAVYQKGYKLAGKDGKVIRHSMVEIYLQD